jgi:hypothetical protein
MKQCSFGCSYDRSIARPAKQVVFVSHGSVLFLHAGILAAQDDSSSQVIVSFRKDHVYSDK